jgi:hypothetical protein
MACRVVKCTSETRPERLTPLVKYPTACCGEASFGGRVDVFRPNEMGGIRRLNPRVAGFGKL